MKIDPKKARDIFARAVELQRMILDAQDDLKQLRADEIEALIDDGMGKDAKKAIRADLSEIIALAKVKAQGDFAREKLAKKMEHRREVADVVGVQLDMLATARDEDDGGDPPLPESIHRISGVSDAMVGTPPSVAAVIGQFGAQTPDDMPDIPPMLDRRPKAPAEAQQSGGGE